MRTYIYAHCRCTGPVEICTRVPAGQPAAGGLIFQPSINLQPIHPQSLFCHPFLSACREHAALLAPTSRRPCMDRYVGTSLASPVPCMHAARTRMYMCMCGLAGWQPSVPPCLAMPTANWAAAGRCTAGSVRRWLPAWDTPRGLQGAAVICILSWLPSCRRILSRAFAPLVCSCLDIGSRCVASIGPCGRVQEPQGGRSTGGKA